MEDFRDPRIQPKQGDEVRVDLGDDEFETRTVAMIEYHSFIVGHVVCCHINGDTSHMRRIKLRHWREVADESTVVCRG